MPRVVHFDITAEDPERALKFYADVFGWTAQKWEGGGMPYWMFTTGPETERGINGGLSKRDGAGAETTNTIEVKNLDAAVESVTSNGGKLLRERMAIPGVGWFAVCEDTERNKFGLLESDTSAS